MSTEQERTDLLPCPFCGESKSLIVQHCEGTIIHPAYRIYCGNCGASSGYSDRVDPAKYWNRRAALQSQDREALTRLLAACPTTLHCDDFHHTKADQHMNNESCPPLDRYLAAIDHARRVEGEL